VIDVGESVGNFVLIKSCYQRGLLLTVVTDVTYKCVKYFSRSFRNKAIRVRIRGKCERR
jgi:hypothetical protein